MAKRDALKRNFHFSKRTVNWKHDKEFKIQVGWHAIPGRAAPFNSALIVKFLDKTCSSAWQSLCNHSMSVAKIITNTIEEEIYHMLSGGYHREVGTEAPTFYNVVEPRLSRDFNHKVWLSWNSSTPVGNLKLKAAVSVLLDEVYQEAAKLLDIRSKYVHKIQAGYRSSTIFCNQDLIDELTAEANAFRYTLFDIVQRKNFSLIQDLREELNTIEVEIGTRIADKMKYKVMLKNVRKLDEGFIKHLSTQEKAGLYHLTPSLKSLIELHKRDEIDSYWGGDSFIYISDEKHYFLMALSFPNFIKSHVQIFTIEEAQNAIKKSSGQTG